MPSMDEAGAEMAAAGRVQMLDLLRMVAILAVISFHFGFLGPAAIGTTKVAFPQLAAAARYGFLGVPIFFAISGFVIAYSAAGRTAGAFAIARVARIYPGFVFCMTMTFLVTLLFGAPVFHTSLTQWAANLFIAATALHQPYMDLPYWSLVIEITFYAWVAVLIAAGIFPRRIDLFVVTWLCISMANELTIDARWVERIFLADYSGFFATGLLIYELHRGRRDRVVQLLLAVSIGTAIFQAVHNLTWLHRDTQMDFNPWIAAAICLVSMLLILWATRVRYIPLPMGVVTAIGGMTYPLYLLHQQIGYVMLTWIGPVAHPQALALAILAAIMLFSWLTWRFVEKPCQRWVKRMLTSLALRVARAPAPLVATPPRRPV